MPKPRIFISYARSSMASVEQIAVLKPALAAAGFDSLQDVQIALGEDSEPKLEEWLAGCHGAVVFVSSEALSSEWVAREVAILMDRHYGEGPERMRIVPIAVGGLDWEDLRKDSTDHRFAPLSAIQGGTNLSRTRFWRHSGGSTTSSVFPWAWTAGTLALPQPLEFAAG